MTIGLAPLMVTSLKVVVDSMIYCSDASPSSGGAVVAHKFNREPETEVHHGRACWVCGGPM